MIFLHAYLINHRIGGLWAARSTSALRVYRSKGVWPSVRTNVG